MQSFKYDAACASRKYLGALAGIALCLAVPPAQAAAPVTNAGPVELIAQINIPAGSPNGSVVIKLIPKGFHLVIQTASYFRSGMAANSIGNLFLQTTLGKTVGYVGLPEAVADGSVYPSGTLTATIYCSSQTNLIANAYRSGSDAAPEAENIIIVGTYVQDAS